MKILITRRIHQDAVKLINGTGFEIQYINVNEPLDSNVLADILSGFDGILSCVSDKIGSELLTSASPRLKVISNMAVGLDNIDVTAAKSLGISVFNTPNVVTESTADMTITIAFALTRHVNSAHTFIHDGNWVGWDPEIFIGKSFSSLTWGIVGFGNIGKAVAQKLSGFGMQVYYFDPDVSGYSQKHAIKTDMEVLLNISDIISLHLPLTSETKHFFDAGKITRMKPTAFLINMARGGIVHTPDLIAALKSNTIAGAGLDVFDPEPIPKDHEILNFRNVLLTPHIGTATVECRRDMAIMATQNIIDFSKSI